MDIGEYIKEKIDILKKLQTNPNTMGCLRHGGGGIVDRGDVGVIVDGDETASGKIQNCAHFLGFPLFHAESFDNCQRFPIGIENSVFAGLPKRRTACLLLQPLSVERRRPQSRQVPHWLTYKKKQGLAKYTRKSLLLFHHTGTSNY